jgi:hypothetical protein
MSIEVIEIDEQPDGTARMIVDIDNETVGILIESAIVTALKNYIDNHETNYNPKQMELLYETGINDVWDDKDLEEALSPSCTVTEFKGVPV